MTADPASPGEIDVGLVRRLVAGQFPKWAGLPVRPVDRQGHDNRTFRLGDDLAVRLPSAGRYAAAVAKEQAWLPRLAPLLPQPIPPPVALGRPCPDFSRPWSVNRWLDGASALDHPPADRITLAEDLGAFLAALQRASADGGPAAGEDTFWRGGALGVYDGQTRAAIERLGGAIDGPAASAVWAAALDAEWGGPPVWVHGDVAPGNLLVASDRLCGVIDFGQACIGDPACDLAIAWSWFEEPARAAFRGALSLGATTWARGRGWALWKALITLARSKPESAQARSQTRVIDAVTADYRTG